MPHHNPWPQYETGLGTKPGTFGLADECSTTELTLLPRLSSGYVLRTEAKCLWFSAPMGMVISSEPSHSGDKQAEIPLWTENRKDITLLRGPGYDHAMRASVMLPLKVRPTSRRKSTWKFCEEGIKLFQYHSQFSRFLSPDYYWIPKTNLTNLVEMVYV